MVAYPFFGGCFWGARSQAIGHGTQLACDGLADWLRLMVEEGDVCGGQAGREVGRCCRLGREMSESRSTGRWGERRWGI